MNTLFSRLTITGTMNLWMSTPSVTGRMVEVCLDLVQGEVRALAGPIADDDMRRMVDTLLAIQSKNRRACRHVFLILCWTRMLTEPSCQVIGVLFPGFLVLVCWLLALPLGAF